MTTPADLETLDLRPGGLRLLGYVNSDHAFTASFPAEWDMTGTWSAFIGVEPTDDEADWLATLEVAVAGDDVTVSITKTQMQALGLVARWLVLLQDDQPTALVEFWPSNRPGAPTVNEVSVSLREATATISAIAPGGGIPAGGDENQVLGKASDDDYDVEWVDQSGGSGGPHAASHEADGSDELGLDGSQITTGTVAAARIDPTIATDAEVAAAVATHAGLADPHPGYLTPAEGNAAYDALGAAAAAQAASDPAGTAAAAVSAHVTDASDAHDASAVSFVPAGSVAATDVQAAIAEVDTEKAPLASPALTGTPTVPTAAQGTNTTQAASTAYVQTEAGLLVPKALFDANSILVANSDNTPLALAIAASRFVGRKSSGDIAAMTAAEALAILASDEHTAPTFKATGAASLGSAVSGRFIGAWTTSGAPTGLTAQVNDYGFDVDGKLWVCTTAGTPGTWVNHDDQLITQAEVTTAITNISAVGAGARVDIDAGLVISVTGARTITLRGCIPVAANNTATNGFGLTLVEGTIGGGIGTLLQQVQMTSATANAVVSLTVERTLTQTSGTHTYKLMGYAITGGVVAVTSGAGTRNSIKALKA